MENKYCESVGPKVEENKNSSEDSKTVEKVNPASTSEEVECNLQTPLMFSRCSSLGSLSGFEQHSVHSSIVSDFSPRASRAESPFNSELSDVPNKSQEAQNNAAQCMPQKMQNSNFLPRKKLQESDKTPFQYDTAFKKPHFFKHSVFEDDIAAFKDESSPNILSTTASSLSSLTIDDDDYGDNNLPSKAGLVKRRMNLMDAPPGQKTLPLHEQWRREPIGSTVKSLHISKANEIKRNSNNEYEKYQMHLMDRQNSEPEFNRYSRAPVQKDHFQREQQQNINYPQSHRNEMKKLPYNSVNYYYPNGVPNVRVEAEGSSEHACYKSDSHSLQGHNRDKFKNMQDNQMFMDQQKSESNYYNKYTNRNRSERNLGQDNEFRTERNQFYQNSHKSNELNDYVDDSNDFSAYEEQLLDQCIRRGMAKVTKQNIRDIKPFSWDLNQICLTTRVILKTHDEEVMDSRQEEYIKRNLPQRDSVRRINNPRTK